MITGHCSPFVAVLAYGLALHAVLAEAVSTLGASEHLLEGLLATRAV